MRAAGRIFYCQSVIFGTTASAVQQTVLFDLRGWKKRTPRRGPIF